VVCLFSILYSLALQREKSAKLQLIDIDIDIYLTAIGLAPCGDITRHIYNQTIPNLHREKNLGSAFCFPSLLSVIPWHSPNNWGKSTEKPSVRVARYQNNGQAQYQNNGQAQYQNNGQAQYQNNGQAQYQNNEQTQYKKNE